jgi:hypothetical protein
MTTSEENNSNPTQKQCSNTKFDMRRKRFKVKEEKKKKEVKEREKKLLKTKTLIITYN